MYSFSRRHHEGSLCEIILNDLWFSLKTWIKGLSIFSYAGFFVQWEHTDFGIRHFGKCLCEINFEFVQIVQKEMLFKEKKLT